MGLAFDWDLLRSFLAVARAGKLTAAARQLKIDHSTLGRRISTLEKTIGTKLFERSLSGYALTPQGEKLLARAETMESNVFGMEADVLLENSQVAGTVRIGTPDGFGTSFLAPRLGGLSERHPHLEIELVATSRNFSLSRREADIVITLSRPTYGRLHARLLTEYELGVYAARSNDRLVSTVRSAEDLRKYTFISYIDDLLFAPELDYLPLVSSAVHAKIRSANLLAQREATAAGVGICILPCFLAEGDPRLVRVLEGEVRIFRTFWMVVHTDVRELARVRTTMDYITSLVQASPGLFLPTGKE